MSLLPGRFYLDDFFNDFEPEKKVMNMNCDIYEKEGKYNIVMDIPGFDKKDVKIEVEDGYLTIHATTDSHKEENEEGKFVRRERYLGECSRSFYIGDDIKDEDIKASFKNGTLQLEIPKKEEKKELPEKRYIPIGD